MEEQNAGEKKLSQLLGEYMEEKKKNPELFLEISTVLMTGSKTMDVYMLSKQFGFIKWLVQNDKIDYSKLVEYEFDKLERFIQRKYNALLMLLSIQDEPVKFLSDILKDE